MKGAGRTLTVAEGAGVIGGLLAFAAAFALSAVMHCLTADMVINSGEHEIPRIFSCLLPPGKRKRQAELLFFVLTALMLTANISAYILGGAEVLCALLPVPVKRESCCFLPLPPFL